MRPRLALIGPVLPFRGGIAQHTTMLHRALGARADLLTLSFSRQYPAWLFPGASDREPGFEGYREPGARYEVDSLNPLTWRRKPDERLAGRFSTRAAAPILGAFLAHVMGNAQ